MRVVGYIGYPGYCAIKTGQFEDYTLKVVPNTFATNTIEAQNLIRVYPNPVGDTLYLEGIENEVTFSIFSYAGTLVAKGNVSKQHSINVAKLTKGVYFIQIDGFSASFIKR